MDDDEARDLAVEFLLSQEADAAQWKMHGPSRESVASPSGKRERWVFGFWPSSGSGDEPTHRVAVDPETRAVSLL
ncbi:hypothetical protein [Streptomyces sp. NPDC005017]|uniref:hypothetical protein n=1 Tax=Streptomyces sp. NPDC005017 TaxID=3364706 RepID=UPI0036BFD284